MLGRWLSKYRSQGPPSAATLRVELRVQGGIAGLDQVIVLDGSQLRITDRSRPRPTQSLGGDQVQELAGMIGELERSALKARYGDEDAGHVFDAMRFFLTYTAGSSTTTVTVLGGSSDSPPKPFWNLVFYLMNYAP